MRGVRREVRGAKLENQIHDACEAGRTELVDGGGMGLRQGLACQPRRGAPLHVPHEALDMVGHERAWTWRRAREQASGVVVPTVGGICSWAASDVIAMLEVLLTLISKCAQ